jgi:purine-nucleoside phosphorylase
MVQTIKIINTQQLWLTYSSSILIGSQSYGRTHAKTINKNKQMDPSFIPYRQAAAYLEKKLNAAGLETPTVGIICGSGLSGLSNALDEEKKLTIQYGDIPGFPSHCTVAGHKGEVVFGVLGGVQTICFRGRFHSYEGHDMQTIVLPVRVMRCLQVKVVIVTNAAGGLNPNYEAGDVVVVSDHVALPQISGRNPLIGPNDDQLGPRFPPTSDMYSEELRAVAYKSADDLGLSFVRKEKACYCFASGPMYESKSECLFLRSVGGDAVGMSTIPELTAAHHCGMKILCLSLITNKVIISGNEGPAASHAEVLEAVEKRAIKMQTLVETIVKNLKKDILPILPELSPISLKVPTTWNGILHKHILGVPLHCYLSSGAFFAGVALVANRATRK